MFIKRASLKRDIAQIYNYEYVDLLIGFVLLSFKLIEREPNLHHALKSVFSFDVISLDSQPEQCHLYIEVFSNSLQRIQKYE
jgi:hypothetical protein